MRDAPGPLEGRPPNGRLLLGVAVLGAGNVGAPLCIPLVARSGLSAEWKTTLSGLLLLGVPEFSILAGVAILGRDGFAYVKTRLLGLLGRAAFPARVSRARHRAGVAALAAVLLYAFLEPYLGHLIRGHAEHRLAFAVAGDALLLAGLVLLGGEFWEKLRALFLYDETRRRLPAGT